MAGKPRKSGISTLNEIKVIENDPTLIHLITNLPENYDFEIAKTVWRIRKIPNCSTVALQMPEGLTMFGPKIADILREMTGVDAILMGDVTFGACCVDDFTASMLGAQLLIHYGHSCLIPTSTANMIETIYIFVAIKFDIDHTAHCIKELVNGKESKTFTKIQFQDDENLSSNYESTVNMSLVSTIQFSSSLNAIKTKLENMSENSDTRTKFIVTIPRSKPLSHGEILGCTAPTVRDDFIVYVGDGRFHLEAMMMANPTIPAYRYDPYNKTLTKEGFDHDIFRHTREATVSSLVHVPDKNQLTVGVILGTLGRQGSNTPMEHVYNRLSSRHRCFVVLMSEVIPAKLDLIQAVDMWVQFACPRLSIDWGSAFRAPLLTPYEAIWGLASTKESKYEGHPMDYYAYESVGPHTPNFKSTIKG